MKFDPVKTGSKRVTAVAIALVALALGWHLKGQPAFRADAPTAAVAASVPARPAISDQSIAVLPFENLSADPDNAFFATGIQDEILTSLAKVGGLRVISRTSTIKYGTKPPNLSAITRELGVANILEGSVQRVGNSVRVNVQLIDARTDQHRWAETYDRKLEDVFAVQSEVAQTIAKALDAKLTSAEQAALAKPPTTHAKAYEHYLRGLAIMRKLNQELLNDSRAWNVTALLSWRVGDFDGAIAAFRRGRELRPNDYSMVSELGVALWSVQRYPEALAAIDPALDLQPGDPAMLSLKLYALWNTGGLPAGARMLAALKTDSATVTGLRALQAEYESADDRPSAEALYRDVVAEADGKLRAADNSYVQAA